MLWMMLATRCVHEHSIQYNLETMFIQAGKLMTKEASILTFHLRDTGMYVDMFLRVREVLCVGIPYFLTKPLFSLIPGGPPSNMQSSWTWQCITWYLIRLTATRTTVVFFWAGWLWTDQKTLLSAQIRSYSAYIPIRLQPVSIPISDLTQCLHPWDLTQWSTNHASLKLSMRHA